MNLNDSKLVFVVSPSDEGDKSLETVKEVIGQLIKDDDDRLEPIMLDVPLGLTHDLEMLDKGINEASYLSGRYTAFVNAGMSSKQAYELIVMQLKHEHEELMFEKQAKVQLEIKEKDIKMALQLNGLKNILNED